MGRELEKLRVPSANNTLNDFMRAVIGNKSDTAAAGAVTATDTIMAYIKQLIGAVDGFVAGTADTSPLASMSLWTISGGPVLMHEIIGVVTTTPIQAQATTIGLILDPTDGGTNVALSATTLDGTGDVTGTIYRWTKDFSEALIALLDASEATDIQAPGVVLMPGDIEVAYGATSTGQINWFCRYTSLGGTLVAAQIRLN